VVKPTAGDTPRSEWTCCRPCKVLAALVLLGLAGALTSGCGSGEEAKAEALKVTPGRRVDFGDIDRNREETLSGEVIVHNQTDSEIHIHTIRSSCRCLEPELERAVIPAGGESKLEIKLLGPFTSGRNRYFIYLHNDSSAEPVVPLEILYRIRKPWKVEPSVVHFGADERDRPLKKTLRFKAGSPDDPFRIESATCDSELIRLGEPRRLTTGAGQRDEWELKVELLRPSQVWVRTWIFVDDGSGASVIKRSIPVIVEPGCGYRVEPSLVVINTGAKGKGQAHRIEITAGEGFKVSVNRVECSQNLEARLVKSSGAENAVIQVTPAADLSPGTHGGSLVVGCGDPEVELEVPVILNVAEKEGRK